MINTNNKYTYLYVDKAHETDVGTQLKLKEAAAFCSQP